MKLAEDSKSSKQSSVASKHRLKGKGEIEMQGKGENVAQGCSPASEAQKILESLLPVGADSNATSAAVVSDVVPNAASDVVGASAKPASELLPAEVVSDAAS